MNTCSIQLNVDKLKFLFTRTNNYDDVIKAIFESPNEGYFYNIDEIAETLRKELEEGKVPFSKSKLINDFYSAFNERKVFSKSEFFDKPILNLYENGAESLNYMYNSFESQLVKISFVDNSPKVDASDAVTIDNSDLNHKIQNYKNSLFKTLFKYAKKQNVEGYKDIKYQDLYVDKRFVSPVLYEKVIKDIETLFKDYSTNVSIYKERELKTLEVYNAAVILVNFDNIIKEKFNNIISVNRYNFGALSDSINTFHYFQEFKGIKTTTWAKEGHDKEAATNYSSNFIKMLAGVIPLIDLEGKPVANQFLGMDRMYLIGVLIKELNLTSKELNNFQTNPKANLKPFLESLLNKKKLEYMSAVKSLYDYLYGSGNIVKKIESAKFANRDIAPTIIDIEAIIAHQINNVTEVIYGKYGKDSKKVLLSLLRKGLKNDELIDSIIRYVTSTKDSFANLSIKGEDITFNSQLLQTESSLAKVIKELTNIDLTQSARSFLKETERAGFDKENKQEKVIKILKNFLITASKINKQLIAKENEEVIKTSLSSNTDVNAVLTAFISAGSPSALMTFKNEKGNSMPTVKQSNLSHEDRTSIEIAKEHFNQTDKILMLENPDLIKGTETLLEIVTDKGQSTEPFYLNPEENLHLNFVKNYMETMMSKEADDYLSVKLVNFSDKSTIDNKIIDQNLDILYGGKSVGNLKNMSLDTLKGLFNNSLNTYYEHIANKIIDNYLRLEGTSIKEAKKAVTHRDIQGTIKSINAFLETITEDEFRALIKKNWVRIEKERLKNPLIEPLVFTEEVTFTKYNGKLSFNNLIAQYIEKLQDGSLVELAEKKFVEKFKEIGSDLNIYSIFKYQSQAYVADVYKTLGLDMGDWVSFKETGIDKFVYFRVQTAGTNTYRDITDLNNMDISNIDKVKLNPIFAKWLHTQNLIRYNYLGITTKHEYQHPHKIKKVSKEDMSFEKEVTGRSISMTKRMVINPATMETYLQGLDNGIPQKIKLAVVKDIPAISYNFTGSKQTHDAWDGSLAANPFLSFLLKNSLPNKGISDVQKAIGHYSSDTHSVFLKCALYTFTNEMIRNSMESEINLDRLMKSMNNIQIEKSLDISSNDLGNIIDLNELVPDGIFYKKGDTIYKVDGIEKVRGNNYKVLLTNMTTGDQDYQVQEINNLYDLWQIFGGAYSRTLLNGKYVYAESSIQAVGNLMSIVKDDNGNLPLKDKMIGILAQESSVKNGATNVNGNDIYEPSYKDGEEIINDIMYSEFDTHFLGVQLDAYHVSDESMVNEISQVVAALAENQATPELYSELYKAIGSIIESEITSYKDKYLLKASDKKILEGNYDIEKLSKEYTKVLASSNRTSGNSKEIADMLTNIGVKYLPFSNNNFFKGFVINLMSKLSSDFIKRKYPGMGAVINPSYKMMQMYRDNLGNTFFHSDLLELATPEDYLVAGVDVTNSSKLTLHSINKLIAKNVINSRFANKEIEHSKLMPLDRIEIINPGIFQEEDTFIFGHPGIGKSHLYNTTKSIIDFDERYKKDINTFIAEQLGKPVNKLTKEERNNFKQNDPRYEAYIEALWMEAKEAAILYGNLKVFASDMILLRKHSQDFDKFLTMTPEKFLERSHQRGEKDDVKTLLWKQDLDTELAKVDPEKIITTDKYLSDLVYSRTSKNLNDIEEYYKTKQLLKNNPYFIVQKIYDTPTDLKPNEITFVQNGISKNIFDIDAIRLNWAYTTNNLTDEDKIIVDKFLNYFKIVDKENAMLSGFVKSKFKAWIQRSFELLAENKLYKPVDVNTDFEDMFKGDDFTNKLSKTNFPNENYLDIITDYVTKPAEIIMPKRYRSEFNIEDDTFAKISRDKGLYFKAQVSKVLEPKTMECDLFLASTTGASLYVSILSADKKKELIDNGTLTKVNYPTEKIKEETFRVDIKGNPLYKVTPELEIFNKNGIEMVVFTESTNAIENKITPFIKEVRSAYEFIYPFSHNISNDNIKDRLKLLEIADKYSMVPGFKRLISNIIKEISPKKVKEEEVETLVEDVKYEVSVFPEVVGNMSESLANAMYSSWLRSNDIIAARIPSQAMQSFMPMKVVGYNEDKGNNVYVSHWQLWLQGSDYDIDKAYIMMFGIKNGIYKGWSPYFDYTTINNIVLSEKLPLPNGKKYVRSKGETALNLTDIHAEILARGGHAELSDIVNILQLVNNSNVNKILLPEDDLGKYLFNVINKHNDYSPSTEALKNFVVRNIYETGNHPRNQVAAYSPITFGAYNKIKEEKENNFFLSMFDGISMDQQQQTNATGKDVIGIAANGIKDYFSLVEYFSHYYKDAINKTDNQYFEREFLINDQVIKVNRIGGLNLEKEATELLNSYIAVNLGIKDMFDPNVDPSLVLSSLLSASTDNAKELILKTINAGKEFASMHIYMIILGFNEGTVANFMTSDENLQVLSSFKNNIFTSSKFKVTPDKAVNSGNAPAEFKKIFNLSKELTFLAKILKINQGLSAAPEVIYRYFQGIENEFVSRENQFLEDTSSFPAGEITVDRIIADKPYLKKETVYIQDVLSLAHEYGISNGGFKLANYFDVKNPIYKQVSINYYNLIKGTFNVMDVMNKLPHFGKMIDATRMVYDQIYQVTKRFEFVNKIVPEALNLAEVTNFKVKYKVPNGKNISLSEKQILNAFSTFDDLVIAKWLAKKATDYNINLKDVQETTKIVPEYFDGSTFVKLGNTDVVIDFTDNNSIVNFKNMVESNLIPYLKTNEATSEELSNNFISGLLIRGNNKEGKRSYLSTRIRMGQAEDPKNLEVMFNYQQGMDKLATLSVQFGEKSYNVRDLLFIYNLIVNKDRYGSDRLTRLFKNYVSDINGEAKDFYTFYSEIDKGSEKLFDGELKDDKGLIDIIAYGVLSEGGVLRKNNDENSIELKLPNPNFTLVTAVVGETNDFKFMKKIDNIIKMIKEKNILISFKCE